MTALLRALLRSPRWQWVAADPEVKRLDERLQEYWAIQDKVAQNWVDRYCQSAAAYHAGLVEVELAGAEELALARYERRQERVALLGSRGWSATDNGWRDLALQLQRLRDDLSARFRRGHRT